MVHGPRRSPRRPSSAHDRPGRRSREVVARPVRLPPPLVATPGPRPAGKRLLIVDDDAFARDTLAQILQEEGYSVSCAANGREALRLMRGALLPDLVLLDLMMPVLDGFAFCRLQERDARLASVPVLVVSAVDVACPSAEAAPQVVGRVHKPIAVEELLECIRQCF